MAFRAPIKVCFSDIDNAGIVYYPRFMHYFHLAMEGFFSAVFDMDYSKVLHERNVACPAVHLESDFKRRIKYGDTIEMEVKIIKIGNSSITWGYTGYLSGHDDVVVEGIVVTVCVKTSTFERIDAPDWLRQGLINYQKSCSD